MKIKRANISYAKKKLCENFPIYGNVWFLPRTATYVPGKRDIRTVTICGKGQCSSEAEEVARVKPEVLPRLNESTSHGDGWYAFHDCDNKCRLATGLFLCTQWNTTQLVYPLRGCTNYWQRLIVVTVSVVHTFKLSSHRWCLWASQRNTSNSSHRGN